MVSIDITFIDFLFVNISFNFTFENLVYGQSLDRTTNFPYVDESVIMDNYENFEEMLKTPLDRGSKYETNISI